MPDPRSTPEPLTRLRDAERLDALRDTGLLDAPPEAAFDRFTALVRRLLGVPVALVSFVDADRQVFVSQDGLPEPWATRRKTPLSHSLCQHVAAGDATLVVPDARDHPVLCDNLAVRDLDVVGYLGVPVHGPGGHALGSLCALTPEPRDWQAADVSLMQDLAALVETEIALRHALREATAATERGQDREDALQASETHLRDVLDSLFAFVAVLAPDGTLLDVNEPALVVSGLTLAEVVGQPFWDCPWWTHDAAVQAHLRSACAAAALGEPSRFDADARIAGGRLLPIDFASRPLVGADGRVTHLVPSGIDISDRVAAEAALRESEARFRQMADAAPALLWVTDADGACTFLSQGWYDTTGQPEAEGLGLGWLDAVHPDDRDATRDVFLAASARGEPFRVDFRLRRRDGDHCWALAVGQPRHDDDGAFVGYVGSVIDIHDRKQAETRSQLLAETGRLTERTLDYEATLAEIARMAVPDFADWCGVDVVQPDGALRPVAIAHADPDKVRWAHALRERYPTDPDDTTGVPQVVRTGRAEIYASIPDEMLVAAARDEPHLHLMREIGFRSVLIVPMRAGDDVTGAITFVLAGSRPAYVAADVETAEEIARRAGAALEMARLHTALREREARYRSLFESVDVGFCILDILYDDAGAAVDYRFLETNPAFVRQSGLEGAEGRTLRELLPEADPAARIATFAAVAESGEATRLAHESGPNDRWYDVYAVRIGGPESRRVAVLSTDISEARAMEQTLRDSRDTFHHLVEHSPFGIYVVDADFRLAQVSDGAQSVFAGVHPLLGRDFAEVLRILWPEPFASEAIGRFRHTLATGEPYHAPSTTEHRHDTDAVETYDWKLERVTLPDRRFGVVCHFYDLSERLRHEQALRESEARFRQLAEALPAIVYTSDADGTPDYLNRRWFEYTGQPAATPIAGAAWTAMHPDDAPAVADAWGRALADGRAFESELRLRRRDGAYRWFRTQVVPVTDADGRVARWFGSSTDIQADKETEAELAERVAEATAELARSNAELDQFAYVASHDLKAPLRAIDSLAAWIEDDAAGLLPPESARHLALLRGRAARMEGLLDSLLAYSRAGRRDAGAEPLDVAAVVADAVALVAPPEGVTVRVDGALPGVTAARAPLSLVFRNLIGNAIKHHDRPDGAVTVSGSVGEDGAFATFTVADDGPGIAPEYHERVFGLFQTLRPRDEVEGSGMGLAIVQKTVEGQGGRIWLEPGAGRGATFHFTWPTSPPP